MSITETLSSVTKVTVYTDRAMVTRRSKLMLSSSIRSLRITGLPTNVQEDSLRIRAMGSAGITLLDFKLGQQEYRDVPETALHTLEEERLRFQDEIAALRDEIATLGQQKSFLEGISVGKSKQLGKELGVQQPNLQDWKDILGFLGDEQRGLDQQRREAELRIRKLEHDIRLIDAELKKYSGVRSKVRKHVTLEVEVAAEGEFVFELSYLIREAHWQPLYDARVDGGNKQVGLRYMGLVNQHTGEDWVGVEVLLSTARPQLGGNAPELRPWHLVAEAPRQQYFAAARSGVREDAEEALSMAGGQPQVADIISEQQQEYDRYSNADEYGAGVEAGQGTSVVFRCAGSGDIPGDGSGTKLLIMDGNFENKFRYLSVPKLVSNVYLTAEVKNNTDYPLLPGRISIFLDGNFIGNSQLKELVAAGQIFELPLGVDERIKIIRKQEMDKGDEKGLFNKQSIRKFAYLITLESHLDMAEEVIVRDQLPHSNDERVKVETQRIHPAENPDKDKDKLALGTVEWKIQLAARSSVKLELAFSVSAPKELFILY